MRTAVLDVDTLEALLADFEREEPELGHDFRESPHLFVLALGRAEVNTWQATPLYYISLPAQVAAFRFFAAELQLGAKLQADVLRTQTALGRMSGGWTTTIWISQRVESLRLAGNELTIRYDDGRGRYFLRAVAPPLPEAQRRAAEAWLAQQDALAALADGTPLHPERLREFGLVPRWDSLRVETSAQSDSAVATGVRFLVAALAAFPAYLPVWRGVEGGAVVTRFIAERIAEQQQAFAAAVAGLPADSAEFWAAPVLPAVPSPETLEPGSGLGPHLPPAPFWPARADHDAFAEALARVYRNVPRRVLKLVQLPKP
jgi:hypothetical protein